MYDTYKDMGKLKYSDPGRRRQMMVFQGGLVVVADGQRVISANLQAHLVITTLRAWLTGHAQNPAEKVLHTRKSLLSPPCSKSCVMADQ